MRERLLRRIALGDMTLVSEPAPPPDVSTRTLDERSRTLVRLGAPLASDPPVTSLQRGVDEALALDVTSDEIVEALVTLMPTIRIARAAAVAPKVGLAIGYDVEAALEEAGSHRAVHEDVPVTRLLGR